jgi:hypothetical protein
MSVLQTIIDIARRIDENPEVNVNMPAATEGELRIAQANAAKSIDEGGLDLRPDNTREERAVAMDMVTPAFHGGHRDILKFLDSLTGNFFAKDPRVAGTYVWPDSDPTDFAPQQYGLTPVMLNTKGGASVDVDGSYFGDIPLDEFDVDVGGATLPLREFAKKGGSNDEGIMTDDIVRAARGAPSVEFKNIVDLGPAYSQAGEINRMIPDNLDDQDFFDMVESAGSDVYAMKDTSRIRSPLAAFDPMRRNSSSLTAGVAGAGILGALTPEDAMAMESFAEPVNGTSAGEYAGGVMNALMQIFGPDIQGNLGDGTLTEAQRNRPYFKQ